MENSLKPSLDKPQDILNNLEERARSFAESLGQLVDSLENVATVAKRFFGIFRQQKQNLVHLSQGAVENVAPVMDMGRQALGRGKELGGKIVDKGRAHPVAVLAGAVAVVGGIALIAYYLREQEYSAQASDQEVA